MKKVIVLFFDTIIIGVVVSPQPRAYDCAPPRLPPVFSPLRLPLSITRSCPPSSPPCLPPTFSTGAACHGLLYRIYRGLLHRNGKLCATGELHVLTSLHSPKRQGDVALKAHVAGVYFKCFRCFRGMLQVFHIDVSKVDHDVAHVAMVVYVCCKRLLQMFYLFFRRMLLVCLFGCCICFTYIYKCFI